MASKKGIAITAAIIAGIVGASFLVWFVPQSSPGDVPRTDSEVLSDIYSRNNDLAASVESDLEQWNNGTLGSQDILGRLEDAMTNIQQMERDLRQRQPAQEWRESYELYGQALDTFAEYLVEIESVVEGDEPAPHQGIDSLKIEWQNYVDESVSAMPISR